ncbi:unnamed protein product [Polarella glacialis]|uniref:Uncharacterized protein n=1 Tax=Polarella glacialis TaxID=89957 RepID=A0A813HGT9_POLGL|nr:unnamed protein product [Polarella glacialis]
MLKGGLMVKRAAAEIALSAGSVSHPEVRWQLAQLAGNQSRYKRLDASGAERSRLIGIIKAQIRYQLTRGGCVRALYEQLAILQADHRLCTIQSRYQALRGDIRNLLRQGAVPTSRSPAAKKAL